MYLPVLTFTFISLSSRLETIMCGVLYLCLLGHLRNSLIPHLQPICPHPLQTARKPQAAALPLSGWSTVRLVDCLYFSLYMNCCSFRHLMPNDMLLLSSITALTSFATSISGSPVYLHGHTAVGTPSFNRQHFSPHPWSASTQGRLLFLLLFVFVKP